MQGTNRQSNREGGREEPCCVSDPGSDITTTVGGGEKGSAKIINGMKTTN